MERGNETAWMGGGQEDGTVGAPLQQNKKKWCKNKKTERKELEVGHCVSGLQKKKKKKEAENSQKRRRERKN